MRNLSIVIGPKLDKFTAFQFTKYDDRQYQNTLHIFSHKICHQEIPRTRLPMLSSS